MFDDLFRDQKDSPEVRYADFVVSGMGKDDTLDGMSKIRRFKKEAFPKILVSVNMLDTGFDCPEVVNLIFARFTRSAILYQQMRGRGTRKIPGKSCFTMFDFVGVCDYQGDEDGPIEGGSISSSMPLKAKTEPRRLLALDINDHIDPTTREWVTIDESGNMAFPEVSEQKAADLGARFEAWLLTREELTPNEVSWLRMIGNQLRANADTMDEFSMGHFAFHPFTLMGGLPQALRVFGGEARLKALLVSLNESIFNERMTATDRAPADEHPSIG